MNNEIFRTVHLKFSDEELAAIDAWQVTQKIRTRSEAIRQLIRHGMESTEGAKPSAYELGEKSRQFMGAPAPSSRQGPSEAQQRESLQQLVREEVSRALAAMRKQDIV